VRNGSWRCVPAALTASRCVVFGDSNGSPGLRVCMSIRRWPGLRRSVEIASVRSSGVKLTRPSLPRVLRLATGIGSLNVPVGDVRLRSRYRRTPVGPGRARSTSARPSSEIHGLRSSPRIDSSSITSTAAASMATVPFIHCPKQPGSALDPSPGPSIAASAGAAVGATAARRGRPESTPGEGCAEDQAENEPVPHGANASQFRAVWIRIGRATCGLSQPPGRLPRAGRYGVTWARNRWCLPPTRVDAKYSSQPSALSTGSPSSWSLFTDGISFGGAKSAVALGRVAYHRWSRRGPCRPAARGEHDDALVERQRRVGVRAAAVDHRQQRRRSEVLVGGCARRQPDLLRSAQQPVPGRAGGRRPREMDRSNRRWWC